MTIVVDFTRKTPAKILVREYWYPHSSTTKPLGTQRLY